MSLNLYTDAQNTDDVISVISHRYLWAELHPFQVIFANLDIFSLLITLDYLHEIIYLLNEKLFHSKGNWLFHITIFLNEMKNQQATLWCAEHPVCSTEGCEAEGQQLQLAASLCLKLNVIHTVTSAQCHTERFSRAGRYCRGLRKIKRDKLIKLMPPGITSTLYPPQRSSLKGSVLSRWAIWRRGSNVT